MKKILTILTFVSMFLMLLCMFLLVLTRNTIFGPIGAIIGLIVLLGLIIEITIDIIKGDL